MHKSILLLSILLLTVLYPVAQTDIPDDPYLNLHSDKPQYIPGETAVFFVTGLNKTGKISLYFHGEKIRSLAFNITEGADQLFWKVEAHASNGTYQVLAVYDDTPADELNATLSFGVQRSDLPVYDTAWYRLQLNVSVYYKRTKLTLFDIVITNLYTNETRDADEVEDYYYHTLDDELDDMVLYRAGHAINLYVRTVDRRFEANHTFAAELGINILVLDAIKLPDDKQVAGYMFILMIIGTSMYVMYRVRKSRQKPKLMFEDNYNVWDEETI